MSDNNSLRRLLVIPVYDEIGKIGRVLSKFTSPMVDEICLIVDSPTKTILREIKNAEGEISIPINIIRNVQRKGIGYAIRKGINYALKNEFDIIVVMAGNDKDDPSQIPRLLTPIVKEDYDYVQGSRFMHGGRRKRNPVLRGIFSRVYPFVWTLFTNTRCTEVTNGFRAYKASIFSDKRINIWQEWLDGYGLEYYVHYKVLTLGYKTKEVAVSKLYSHKRGERYSKISPLKDWWDIVRPLIYLKTGSKT